MKLKKEYGDKLILMGNVSVNTLAAGTPDEVYKETAERLKSLAPGGGYILSSSNSMPNYCKPENILAMKLALEDYGWY